MTRILSTVDPVAADTAVSLIELALMSGPARAGAILAEVMDAIPHSDDFADRVMLAVYELAAIGVAAGGRRSLPEDHQLTRGEALGAVVDLRARIAAKAVQQ